MADNSSSTSSSLSASTTTVTGTVPMNSKAAPVSSSPTKGSCFGIGSSSPSSAATTSLIKSRKDSALSSSLSPIKVSRFKSESSPSSATTHFALGSSPSAVISFGSFPGANTNSFGFSTRNFLADLGSALPLVSPSGPVSSLLTSSTISIPSATLFSSSNSTNPAPFSPFQSGGFSINAGPGSAQTTSLGFGQSTTTLTSPFLNTGATESSAPVFCVSTPGPAAAATSSSSATTTQASLSLAKANAKADWDKGIMRNQDALLSLENAVENFVEAQAALLQKLGSVGAHQQEVDKALKSIEEQFESIYKDDHGLLHDDDAASTRDAMYGQVESIHKDLDYMQKQVNSRFQALNANQAGEQNAAKGTGVLNVVIQILNNQQCFLKFADERVQALSSRIAKLGSQGSVEDQ